MRLRLIILCLLLPLSLLIKAEEFKPMTEMATFEKALKTLGEQTNSLQSHFRQEKKLKLFTKPITSEGDFFFRKPNRVRLSYQTPQPYDLIIDGTTLHTIAPNNKNSIPLKNNQMLSQISDLIQASMMGHLDLLKKDFSMDFYEATKAYKVVMTPKSEALKRYVASMTITFNKKEMLVTELIVIEGNGDSTHYLFSKQEINTINDETPFIVK